MQLGWTDAVLYIVFAVTLALAANHFMELNNPILNNIQASLLPGSIDDEDIDDDYGAPGPNVNLDCTKAKSLGDAKYTMRINLEKAIKQNDYDRKDQLEARIKDINEKLLTACQ